MSTKVCTKCGEAKAITEFYANKGGARPGLVASECKECKKAYLKRHYQDPERRAKVLAWSDSRYQELRKQVFEHYGNKCACCGESEPLFLTLDHINNDGANQRRALAKQLGRKADYRSMAGKRMYYRFVKYGFPDDLQLLCSNCNHGKFRNGGICPHQTRSAEGSTTIPKGSTQQALGKCGAPIIVRSGEDIVCSAE